MLEVFLEWGNVCIQAGQWPLTSKMVCRCCLSEDNKEMWTACGDMFGLWHKNQTSLMTSYWNGQSYSQKNSKCLESKAFFFLYELFWLMSSTPKSVPWALLLPKVAGRHDTNNHNVTVFWWTGQLWLFQMVSVSGWLIVSAEPSGPGC